MAGRKTASILDKKKHRFDSDDEDYDDENTGAAFAKRPTVNERFNAHICPVVQSP